MNYRACCLLIILINCFLLFSCTSSQRGLFASRTPHEKYEDKLANAGLKVTALGIQWFSAADRVMRSPSAIHLPYKETGYFAAERPNAAGYVFACRRGEKLLVSLTQKPAINFKIFADVWQYNGDGTTKYLQSADTATNALTHEIEKDGNYLLRLQPELLGSGEYTLTITTAPSLAFPVPASAKPRIESIWGDNRDAGIRKHEGIDIFAKFRTPVVAAANGSITQVNENKLGGKAVFMRPAGKNYTLYYAHLDSQLVHSGDMVKTGDTLGLMGNTGNARTTPTHLHFGIYTFGGAINPLPFVETGRQTPYNITAPLNVVNDYVHTAKAQDVYNQPNRSAQKTRLEPFALLYVEAATANWYKVRRPDSTVSFISSDNISATVYRKYALAADDKLYDKPDTAAAVKQLVAKGTVVDALGVYGNFYFVSYNDATGWLAKQ